MGSYSDDSQDESQDDWSQTSGERQLTELKSAILNRITNVHSAGSFATFGSSTTFALPGIIVEDVGAIRLPLSSYDARSLIQASRKAPFGKGDQTLVDETVRKTWEIDGSRVSFSNNAWYGWLGGIVKTVAQELGVAGGPDSVRAELYKMLLYEEGAMFKPHKDTEKTPGMFGTLVICLPSEHTGGAVRLKHNQKEKTYATAETSEFNTAYIAWYADVTHEIEPVHSGYRWVLTYNLIHVSPSMPQSAARLDHEIASFAETLSEWHNFDQAPQCLCYAFDYQYTKGALKLATLKGDDYYQARFVADACNNVGEFCVLLASMVLIETWLNDDGGEDEKTFQLKVNNIVDLEGFVLQQGLNIPETFLLQDRLYKSRDPDERTGGEYMGNQHAEIDEVYRDTVLLIIPKAKVIAFLLGRDYKYNTLETLFRNLYACFKGRDSDQNVRELIVQTCQSHLTRKYQNHEMRDLILGLITVAAVHIADQDLFREAVHLITCSLDESTCSDLGSLISFDMPVIRNEDLIEAFSKIPKLYQLRRCLRAFQTAFTRKGSNEQQIQHVIRWSRDRMSHALVSLRKAYPQDAAALIEMMKEDDDGMFNEHIKPFISRFLWDADFSNALAVELLSFLQSPSTDQNVAARLLPLVLDTAASQFELEKWSSINKNTDSSRQDYPYSLRQMSYSYLERANCDASIIASLHKQLFQSHQTNASVLLAKIQSQTESISRETLKKLVIPLLKEMIYIVNLCPLDARQFYKSMITTYIMRVVGKEPEKPSDWARPNENETVKCSDCTSCQMLQEFLMDPGEESRTFTVTKEKEWHFQIHSIPSECNKAKDESQKLPTWTVTKTCRYWEANHNKWKKDASETQRELRQLPEEALKQCLADEYNVFMNLDMVGYQGKDVTA